MQFINFNFRIMLAGLLLTASAAYADDVVTVKSPDEKNILTVTAADDGSLSYSLTRNGVALIAPSAVGIVSPDIDLAAGLTVSGTSRNQIDETYTLPTGKSHEYVNRCNELTVSCTKDGTAMDIIFRVYNDGAAFRYNIKGEGTLTVSADRSTISIPSLTTCWAQKYSADYSMPYPARTWEQMTALEGGRMCAPALVKTTGADDWCLVTESANDGLFCTSALVAADANAHGTFSFAVKGEPVVQLPWLSPWRTIYVGSINDIVESSLNDNLNAAPATEDWSWVHAGLSSWDWGGMDGSQTHDINVIKGFIDMAHIMGWPYYTLDDGWATSSYQLSDVTRYARSKGVEVFIWSHQNRFKNDYDQVYDILSHWHDLGFVGIKVDFFEDDSQEMMEKYDKILRAAAELKMMVNLHGCVKPSGLRRTYPNLITSEAVWGGEHYYFDHLSTQAHHNVTLALTRNVIGAMDYTPTEFARRDGVIRHTTTWSHQLALATLYESGIQTMSDSPENVIYSVGTPLLKVLPAAWDETRCLEAVPDEYVTMARRSGDDWYIASISKDARDVQLPLDFLGEGEYTAQIYADGSCPSDISYSSSTVNSSSTLRLPVKATGGVTVRISKKPHHQPDFTLVEAENGDRSNGTTLENDNDGNCSGKKFVGFLGYGRTLKLNYSAPADGVYGITVYYITRDTRSAYFKVNDGEKAVTSFQGNGFSWGSDGLAFKTIFVKMTAGDNTIEIGNDNGDCPNIDRLVVFAADEFPGKVNVASIDGMTDRTGYTAEETITASIINNGMNDIEGATVSYTVNDGEKVTGTLPAIAAGATINYSFAAKADLSTPGNYVVRVFVDDDNTRNILGSMASATFAHLPEQSASDAVSTTANGGSIHSFSAQVNDSESPVRLLDTDDATKWCDNSSDMPWVIIKLPALYDINRFVLRDCKTRENDKNIDRYTISVSTEEPEKNQWTDVVDTYARRCDNIKIDNISPVAAEYIRLSVRRPDGDNAVRIYAFDAYGTITNGIGTIARPDTTDDYSYNTMGQRVDDSYKGIVISHGRKYINK